MSVIIRLQNLPWSANALDIRQFFTGLSIPEGGVHIVGGELGDAFIAFSTDEDARQAFSRNNGKIKEVQISLMLSSRTEMQRVIEAARAQSYAAFMQTAPATVPLPAVVPAVIPSSIPEMKKEIKDAKNGDKKDNRRRSRSKSRDRKDRSRERDRKDKRHRDRSRSRSRDRKERRRRDRSRSRGRSRSRDRDRRGRDHRKRSEERPVGLPFQRDPRKPLPEVWANQAQPKTAIDVLGTAQASNILGTFPVTLDQAKRTLNTLTAGLQVNGFPGNNTGNNFNNNPAAGRMRDSWPPAVNQNFQNANRSMDNAPNKRGNASGPGMQDQGFPNRFQRNFQKDSPRNRMHNNDIDEDLIDCCVSLEPFYGGYGEVRRFFQGLYISNRGIKFINDSNGRRTGIVYIQFANQKTKDDALSLDGKVLNNIQVSVSHVNDNDFHNAVDRFTPMINLDDNSNDSGHMYKSRSKNVTKYFNNPPAEPEIKDYTCLTVEDLPTYCKEQDILHIFSQHPLVALILTSRPRGGHIAYVRFSSKDVAKKAYEEKGHHVVGGKQVTVKPCKDEVFEEINKQHEVDLTGDKDEEEEEDVGTDCLSVSRLPPKTSDKDIADFFSDIGVIPTKIHLMSNNLGFTGQAYCEFVNSEEATRAVKKDDTMLGNIHISVKPIVRDEMTAILGHTMPAPTGPTAPIDASTLPGQKKSVPGPNKPGVGAPINSPNNPANVNAMPPNPEFMGPMGGHPMNRPFFRNFENGPPRGGPRFGPRGMGPRGPRFAPMQMDHFDEAPPPGCTVYMKNVPYKAGTNEILDFFDGYNITNNVSRRYNPNNTPSDEAKVVFFDPDEAFRAVQELHTQKIWDRQIFLRQE